MSPDLSSYDWIVINSSAGKDSQVMLDRVVQAAIAAGVPRSRLVVVHADLGRAEWAGTRELAEYQAAVHGLRFEVVARDQDLLAHVLYRGRWPDSGNRYCTSDHKRDQVSKLFTRLTAETLASNPRGYPVRILNCMGLRAQESPARAARAPLTVNKRASNGKRDVTDWLPIFELTEEQVWAHIHAGSMPYHYAYDLGMPRLSCMLCIFATPAALMIAGYHNRNALGAYVGVEDRTGHTFRHKFTLRSIQERLAGGEEPPAKAASWACA